MVTTLNVSDLQRHLKDKILPLVEMGEEIIIEDAKNHEQKFKIVPLHGEDSCPHWPDFRKRAEAITSTGDITAVLAEEREEC